MKDKPVVVKDKSDVIWLDGYLEGLTMIAVNLSRHAGTYVNAVTFSALALKLPGDNILQAYQDFINHNEDIELLGLEPPQLRLTNATQLDDWYSVVTEHFYHVFNQVDRDTAERALNQALDWLDMITSESFPGKVIAATEVDNPSGNYLFFQGEADEYLVLTMSY